MSTDPKPDSNLRQILLDKAWNASSVEEYSDLVSQLGDEELGSSKGEVAYAVFQSLKRFTFDDPNDAEPFITQHLWKWCLKPKKDDGAHPTYSSSGMQQLLEEWIYQYKREDCLTIRDRLLAKVESTWDGNLSKELIWLTTSIGVLTSSLFAKLEKLAADRSNPLNDTAIGALVYHGLQPKKRDWLLDLVAEKVKKKDMSRGCILAVQDWVGPHRTELAMQILNLALELHPNENHIDVSVVFSIASKVADRSPDNEELHKQIWNTFRQHYKTIRMTPSFANSCNTDRVVRDHIDWFLKDERMDGEAPDSYIKISRFQGLVQEKHLSAWDSPAAKPFKEVLRHYATLDTGNSGRGMTTRVRTKQEAWELALTAGCDQLESWVEQAVLDETSAHAANYVAEVFACVRPQHLPKKMLDSIATVGQIDANGFEWTRHLGMIELAKSCSDSASMDALLNFGLTRRGNVLLSTLNAITDCALTRIREGDASVVDKVLSKTTHDSKKHHREASISAFCLLAIEQVVPQDKLSQLWSFATDDRLDEYSRCCALEAIGLSKLPLNDDQVKKLIETVKFDESDIGWRALEVLIRKNLSLGEHWQLEKLGIEEKDGRLVHGDAESAIWWQAFLIGLLFRKSEKQYCYCVASIIEHSDSQSLYQLLNPIETAGADCPEVVASSLINRIKKSNGRFSADTELFRVLLALSEKELIGLCKFDGISNWLPVARSSLCEAVGKVALQSHSLAEEAMATLAGFTGDASFQVRRTAYRALSKKDPTHISLLCAMLSSSNDIELRKRAAEAVSWLPRSSYSDELIEEFGLAWDRESQVREVYKGTIQRRRNKELKDNYTEKLLAKCTSDKGVAKTYKYGRALEKLGDDETIESINSFFTGNVLKPNVGHYLSRLRKTIQKNWKKKTEKWPEPWEHEKGFIEEVSATLLIPGHDPLEVQLKLSCRYRKDPSKLNDWTAIAVAKEGDVSLVFNPPTETVEIRIQDRESAKANIFNLNWLLNGSKAVFTLGAASNYPEKRNKSE